MMYYFPWCICIEARSHKFKTFLLPCFNISFINKKMVYDEFSLMFISFSNHGVIYNYFILLAILFAYNFELYD